MGNFLDAPKTEKDLHEGAAHGYKWGLAAMQGWRVSMEDSHTAVTELDSLPDHGLFAVFDGHGGSTASLYSGEHLPAAVLGHKALKDAAVSVDGLKDALYQSFFTLDEEMLVKFPNLKNLADRSGATALASIVTPTHIIIANAGDSRAVVGHNGGVSFATEDHKPTNATETERIEAAGGTVEFERVCGNLAVSRAVGDFTYKQSSDLPAARQQISAEPDMTVIERKPEDEFLLLACDGIWDVVSNEKAHEYVINHLKAGFSAQEICSKLLDYCLQLKSMDNMSALLVVFEGAPGKIDGFELPDYSLDQPAPAKRPANAAGPPTGPLGGDPAAAGGAPNPMLQMLMNLMQAGGEPAGDDDDDEDDDGEAGAQSPSSPTD